MIKKIDAKLHNYSYAHKINSCVNQTYITPTLNTKNDIAFTGIKSTAKKPIIKALEALKSKHKSNVIIISGPSGTGKGDVIKGFLDKNPNFNLSISYTTRAKREGDIDGVNYFFITKEEFKKSVENNEFLEWAEFADNYYGTKKDFVTKSLQKNKDLLLEIDTQGALQVKEKMPEAISIFIAPPSYKDLEFRLRNRKTESEEEIAKRLDFYKKVEIKNSEIYDKIIVNENGKLENTIKETYKYIQSRKKPFIKLIDGLLEFLKK